MHKLRQNLQNCTKELKSLKQELSNLDESTIFFLFSAPIYDDNGPIRNNVRYLPAVSTILDFIGRGETEQYLDAKLRLQFFNDQKLLDNAKSSRVFYILVRVQQGHIYYEDLEGKKRQLEDIKEEYKLEGDTILKSVIIQSNQPSVVKAYLQKRLKLDEGIKYYFIETPDFGIQTRAIKQLKDILKQISKHFEKTAEDKNKSMRETMKTPCSKMYDNPYQYQNNIIYQACRYLTEKMGKCIMSIYGQNGTGKQYVAKLIRYHCLLKRITVVNLDKQTYNIQQLYNKKEKLKQESNAENELVIIEEKFDSQQNANWKLYENIVKLVKDLPDCIKVIILLDRPSTTYRSEQYSLSSPDVHSSKYQRGSSQDFTFKAFQTNKEQAFGSSITSIEAISEPDQLDIKDIRIRPMQIEEIYDYFMQKLEDSKYNSSGKKREKDEETLPEMLDSVLRQKILDYLKWENERKKLNTREVKLLSDNFIKQIQKNGQKSDHEGQSVIQDVLATLYCAQGPNITPRQSTQSVSAAINLIWPIIRDITKEKGMEEERVFDNTTFNPHSLTSMYFQSYHFEQPEQHKISIEQIRALLKKHEITTRTDSTQVLTLCLLYSVWIIITNNPQTTLQIFEQDTISESSNNRVYIKKGHSNRCQVKLLMMMVSLLKMQVDLENKIERNGVDSISTFNNYAKRNIEIFEQLKRNLENIDVFQSAFRFAIFCYYQQYFYYCGRQLVLTQLKEAEKMYTQLSRKRVRKGMLEHHNQIMSVMNVMRAEKSKETVMTKVHPNMKFLYRLSKLSESINMVANTKDQDRLWMLYNKFRKTEAKSESKTVVDKFQIATRQKQLKIGIIRKLKSEGIEIVLVRTKKPQKLVNEMDQKLRILEYDQKIMNDFKKNYRVLVQDQLQEQTTKTLSQVLENLEKEVKGIVKFRLPNVASRLVELLEQISRSRSTEKIAFWPSQISQQLYSTIAVRLWFDYVQQVEWDQQAKMVEQFSKTNHHLMMFLKGNNLLIIRNYRNIDTDNEMLISMLRDKRCRAHILVAGNKIKGLND